MSVVELEDPTDESQIDPADVVAEHGPFLLTHNGAVVRGTPTYDEWYAAITWAKQVEKASPFWVGDLLQWGEAKFGEMASQVHEAIGYEYQTSANAQYVCKKIPPERRRPTVPFSHHAEVASLPPAEQDKWLDKCETENLTREQLRVQLRAEKGAQSGTPVTLWLTVSCVDAEDMEQLSQRMKGEGRSVKMHAGTKES